MSRISLLWAREIGDCTSCSFQRAEESQRVFDFQLSDDCQIQNVQTGGINSLHLDPVENRYLLCGSSDKLIVIYDTWNSTGKKSYTIQQIAVIGRPQHSRFAHQYSISCVQWYQHDNAIFTTSSTDQSLKIWDANALRPAETFKYKFIVNTHAMSPLASSHNMIAVGTSDSSVYLADMRTGSNSHILRGHRHPILAVKWSVSKEYEVATGSEDNRILLWDVRQARGHLLSFDQHNGKDRKSKKGSTAHNGHVNGICFSTDGLFMISTGTDNRLRLWNATTGQNTLTNYGRIENSYKRPVQMSFNTDSNTVFVPSDRHVLHMNVQEGTLVKKLSGHFNRPTCCEFNPRNQEMYSGGQDGNILVWGAPSTSIGDVTLPATNQGSDRLRSVVEPGNERTTEPRPTVDLTADTWSDDETDG
ncbi:DNA excision repair protein ERCC-8-like [Styela clava]